MPPVLDLVIRSASIYIALLVGLRMFGKRAVGQFTVFDLVFLLLVANAVQPAMTGPDSSLGGGLVIIATLLFLNALVGLARERVPLIRRLVDAPVTILATDGKWDESAMQREGVDSQDAEAALREHGLETVGQARLVVLEADGSLSVVPQDPATVTRRRRRVRFVRHR